MLFYSCANGYRMQEKNEQIDNGIYNTFYWGMSSLASEDITLDSSCNRQDGYHFMNVCSGKLWHVFNE